MTKRASYVAESRQAERDAARKLGAVRLPATGHVNMPDIDGGWFVGEVKHRKISQFLKDAMQQARQAAMIGSGPMPLVVLVDKPGPGKKAEMLVVMDADSFVEWNGRGCDER